ncbi:MAG: N-acetylmuramoyl-L-alanine amidase [Clostridiales bacterium]|nr:N-acetylmuramoyl-L-alanine amidase [Clostridiales bacterium]
MRWLPGKKGERKLTMAVLLVVMLGIFTAVAAFERQPRSSPMPLEAEAPGAMLPLNGWRILVDAGHGGYDGGARARDSGVWEKEINLAVARQVEKALVARGAEVFMTRAGDEDLCTDNRPANKTMKREDMENRVAIAVEGKVDMVLSIHMNEYRSRSESGPQVFYRQGSDSGRLLAGAMQEALIIHLQPKKQRAALAGDYFILQLEVPSVLIECGFISNPAEEKLLLSPAYQEKLGQAVAEGVESYAVLAQGAT